MKLTCYAVCPDPPKIVPARADRAWMDEIKDRHAYRCLPLAIANAYGWEILSPCALSVTWNGGVEASSLTVEPDEPFPGFEFFANSHFAYGIVTFHVGYLFRTEPGWDLLATGPYNAAKDGIAPLTGVIEADWLPYPFTMNWRMTRPGTVRFEKDEPLCSIYPVAKGALETVEPVIRSLEDDPRLHEDCMAWRERRNEFIERCLARDNGALSQGWQRHYFLGSHPDGRVATDHASKLRLKAPVDQRGVREDDQT